MKDNSIYSTAKALVDKYDFDFARKAYRWEQKQVNRFWVLVEGQRLKRFKNLHAGKRCFIIGNGPSILKQDLTRLRDEIVFVTNSFALHHQYNEINPNYYCVSDSLFFFGSNIEPEWYHSQFDKTANAVKFLPQHCRPMAKKYNIFTDHQVFYLNYLPVRIYEIGSMSLDVTKEVYTGDTIIIDFCLPLAFYMGFSEIYLVGCDCDYRLDEAEDYSEGYFYDVRQVTHKREAVEYHRRYWFNNVIASFKIAKEAFERYERKIYNAGFGGKLEVFERVDFNTLVPNLEKAEIAGTDFVDTV